MWRGRVSEGRLERRAGEVRVLQTSLRDSSGRFQASEGAFHQKRFSGLCLGLGG